MKRIVLCSLSVLLVVVSILAGVHTTSVEKANGDTAAQGVVVPKKLIDVPTISQYPALPTGCESVAATMVLQYYGVDITAQDFALHWLECSRDFYRKRGRLYGPDPRKVFAGDPFTENSYGCFAEPIADAVNRNSADCNAQIITDRTLEELCEDYVDNDKPLLIWATMKMQESYKGNAWHLEDGSLFTWIAREHCLVLVGYNEAYYLLNDPMTGSVVAYPKSVVEKRFAELGMQAVYIGRNG